MRLPTYFRRLLVFTLSLGTLPVILLGAFSYVKSSEMIQQKVNQSNIQLLVEKQTRIENMLKVMDNNVIQFICSSTVRDSMNASFYPEDFQTLNNLTKNLYSMQNSELNIRNVHLINLARGWDISNDGLHRLGSDAESLKFWNYNFSDTSFWINDEGSIVFVRKIPVSSITPTGFISVEISRSELSKLLNANYETDEIMILDNDSNVLVHNGDSVTGNKLLPEEILDKINGVQTGKGYTDTYINNRKVGITFVKSGYTKWTYIDIVSIDQVTRDSKAIGWFTIFTCLAILALSSMVSFQGSHKIYNPVRMLCDFFKKEIEPEHYKKEKDEFKFIRERINLLINTQSRMADTIEGQLGQLKELFFLKLLNGKLKLAEISEQLKLFPYPDSLCWFYILAIKIDLPDGKTHKDQDHDLIMFTINNIVGKLTPEQNLVNSLFMDEFHITLIGSGCDDYKDMKNHTFNLAQNIQKAVYEYLHIKISVGISRPFNDFTSINTAYKEAVETLRHGSLLGQEMIIFMEDIQLNQLIKLNFPGNIEYELQNAIKCTDAKKASSLLKQFLAGVFKESSNSSQYRIYITRLLIDLIEMTHELGEPFNNLYTEVKTLFDQLFMLKTMSEVEQWFKDSIIGPVIQLLKECRGYQYRKISSEVIDIIYKYYDTDLSLEWCASKMNYHPSYISRVFSAETGITFSEYLSRYRLEVAKKWLVNTDMKIQEIAEKLQYKNSQNFIRHFRKSIDMTPGQYREQYYKLESSLNV